MEEELNYFAHQIFDWFLIGESPDQIINTLKYYKDIRSQNSPAEKEI